jgi:hypothetical protein
LYFSPCRGITRKDFSVISFLFSKETREKNEINPHEQGKNNKKKKCLIARAPTDELGVLPPLVKKKKKKKT